MSVRFRLLVPGDLPEAVRLTDLVGWNQTATDWERFLSASPKGCFAAECDGHLVGTSATIIYDGRFAWIGMVIVDSQFRGQGIGGELLERAIRHLDSHGVPCIKLDATPQGRPLYEKFGFLREYDIERWMLQRQPRENTATTASTNISEDINDVLSIDREVFGADRSALLHSLTEAAPEFTLVVRRATEILGYALGRRGARADHFGPWMARCEDVAARVLDQFLRRSRRELVFVDCPRQNPWAIPLVKARGFEFSRPLTRMFRGSNIYPGRPELLGAVLGPEFG